MGDHLRTILVLGRVSNLPTVWTNVLAGWFLAGGSWSGELGWMMAGVSLLYVGGMTLNDAFDVEWDKKHAVDRPVPAGVISARAVWILGWGQMVAGSLLVGLFTSAAWYFLLALVAAILLYDWSHKRWKGAVLVMGACRFLVYVVAASAVVESSNEISRMVWILGGVLFVYVVGITIAARGESIGGTVSWGGKLLLRLPVLIGVAVIALWAGGGDSVIVAAFIFVLWMIYASSKLKSKHPARIGKFVSALLAGIILVDLIALIQYGSVFWLICGALLLLTLLAQRWIPAT